MRSINIWRTWFLLLRHALLWVRVGLLWSIRSARLLLDVLCGLGRGSGDESEQNVVMIFVLYLVSNDNQTTG